MNIEHAFISVGENVHIYPSAKIVGAENIEIGANVIIDDFVFIFAAEPCFIGNYVHIASYTSITGGGGFYLEDFATLSSGIRVLTGTDDFLGEGLANSTIPEEFRTVVRSKVIMKTHSIVGANSVILPGKTLGEGVAVGAGAVVTHDLEPWGIYAGVPARFIRSRPSARMKYCEEALFRKYGVPSKRYLQADGWGPTRCMPGLAQTRSV